MLEDVDVADAWSADEAPSCCEEAWSGHEVVEGDVDDVWSDIEDVDVDMCAAWGSDTDAIDAEHLGGRVCDPFSDPLQIPENTMARGD